MGLIPNSNPIPGCLGAGLAFPGIPSAGTNAIQTLTFGGTGAVADTFQLALSSTPGAPTTAAITWSSTNSTLVANIDAALEALASIGTGGVTTAVGTMTSGIGTITVTFVTLNAGEVVPTMVPVNIVTTGSLTVACATTTPGVGATFRNLPKGAVVNDITHGVLYSNQGTPTAPVFTKVSGT